MLRFILIFFFIFECSLPFAQEYSIDDYHNHGAPGAFDRAKALIQSFERAHLKTTTQTRIDTEEALLQARLEFEKEKQRHEELVRAYTAKTAARPTLEADLTHSNEAIKEASRQSHDAILELERTYEKTQAELQREITHLSEKLERLIQTEDGLSRLGIEVCTDWRDCVEYISSLEDIRKSAEAKYGETHVKYESIRLLHCYNDIILEALPPYYKILLGFYNVFVDSKGDGQQFLKGTLNILIHRYKMCAHRAGHAVYRSYQGRQAESQIKELYSSYGSPSITLRLLDELLEKTSDIWKRNGFFAHKKRGTPERGEKKEVSEEERNAALKALGIELSPHKKGSKQRQSAAATTRARARATAATVATAPAAAVTAAESGEAPLEDTAVLALKIPFYGKSLSEDMIIEDDIHDNQSEGGVSEEAITGAAAAAAADSSMAPLFETPSRAGNEEEEYQGAVAAAAATPQRTESIRRQRWTLREGAPAFMEALFSPHGRPSYEVTLRGLIRLMNQTRETHYTARRYGKRGSGSSVSFVIPSFDQKRDIPCFYHEPHGGDRKSARFVSWYIAIRNALIEAGYATEEDHDTATAAAARNTSSKAAGSIQQAEQIRSKQRKKKK